MIRKIMMIAAALTIAALPALAETKKAKQAVEIEADQMEVVDADKRSVFTGKVVAVRGDMTMHADKMVADYAEAKQPDGTVKNEISKIDATGHVVIITKKQKVTGEWAKINPVTNDMIVGGNVVLTEGKTVLKGPRLEANLDTDRMVMKGGRVKGSFVPQ